MDIETRAKLGGSYEPSEPSAQKIQKMETAEIKSVVKSTETTPVKSLAEADDKSENEKGNKHQPSEATIIDAVSSANHRMEKTRCEYSYHKETNRVSIKVFDADTDEVIREIPPEKSLDMLQKMWEMAGILIDEKR